MDNSKQVAMLKYGDVESWNLWRRENPNIEVDLSLTDLRNRNLSFADLRNIKMHNVFLDKAKLNETDFSGSDLFKAHFSHADLGAAIFCDANLSYVHFSGAVLSGADLTATDLTGACLDSTQLFGANFTNANLTDADLSAASLSLGNFKGASFNNADISNANLRYGNFSYANFEEANLTETNVLDANFEFSILTGACIKDWHINSRTNLEGVICDYIYQNCEQSGRKYYLTEYAFLDRLPHDPNRNFMPGEFTRLYQQALEIVTLIFSDGIDWKAFLDSFQALQIEAGNIELSILAVEQKLNGSLVVKVGIPASLDDKAEIEKAFFRKYKKALKARTEEYRKLLSVKDEEIKNKDSEIKLYRQHNTDLKEILKLKASQPIFTQVHAMSEVNINQSGNFGVGVNQGELKDKIIITGDYNEFQHQDLTEVTKEIQAILNQLEQTYPTETVSQQIEVANQALQQIEQTPALKRKLLSAGKEAGIAALDKALNNPIGVFLTTFLKEMLKER